MAVLAIAEREVYELLSLERCIDLMESAFQSVHDGAYAQPPRMAVSDPHSDSLLVAMPAYVGDDAAALGAKLITVFPQNRSRGLESHQGIVALFDRNNGELLALLHAGALTALRTAAVSGLATRFLARPQSPTLAILGSGLQARMHLEAMRCVLPITRVRVWSRTRANAEAFAAVYGGRGMDVDCFETAREAVRGADVVCTVTAATAPILEGAWLVPSVHVNAAGSSVPPFRELDSEAVVRARVFIDHADAALREADDLRVPIAEGRIAPSSIAGTLGDVVAGAVQGRRHTDEITIFKSVGMAIEDMAAAAEVYARARENGRGTEVAL